VHGMQMAFIHRLFFGRNSHYPQKIVYTSRKKRYVCMYVSMYVCMYVWWTKGGVDTRWPPGLEHLLLGAGVSVRRRRWRGGRGY
jgi:hypothetical protein